MDRDVAHSDWTVGSGVSSASLNDTQWNGESMSMDEIIAHVRVDDRLASYETFFDHQWAKDIRKLASGTKLAPVVDSLTFHWKSVANAHLEPIP